MGGQVKGQEERGVVEYEGDWKATGTGWNGCGADKEGAYSGVRVGKHGGNETQGDAGLRTRGGRDWN